MLGQIAVQDLAGLSGDFGFYTMRGRVGHIANPLAGNGQKTCICDGAKEAGEHARPAWPLSKLHRPDAHFFRTIGRSEGVGLGRQVRMFRVAGGVCAQV